MAVEDVTQKGIATVQDTVASTRDKLDTLSSKVKTSIDQVFPPEKRDETKQRTISYSKEHPLLVSFLLTFFIFALPVLVTFLSVAVFIILTPAVLAISFIVFWLSLAVIGLVGVLAITLFIATSFWVWAVGSLFVGQFVYRTARKVAGKVRGTTTSTEKKLVIVSKPNDGATAVGINGDGSLGRVEHFSDVDGVDGAQETRANNTNGLNQVPQGKGYGTPFVGTEEVLM